MADRQLSATATATAPGSLAHLTAGESAVGDLTAVLPRAGLSGVMRVVRVMRVCGQRLLGA